MAENVIGKNIMLYVKGANAKYYFNGSVSQGSFDGLNYEQLSTTNVVNSGTNFSRVSDGPITGFITNVGNPGVTTIASGTWTFQNYMSLTGDLTGAPRFYYKIYKVSGSTFTLLGTTGGAFFTTNAKALYTSTFSFPSTTMLSTDRIAVVLQASEITDRTITLYTQGDNLGVMQTNIPQDIPFACSTNCSFSVTVDQKEVTSQSSAWYREFKNDVANWNISCEGLITLTNYSYLNMLDIQQSRTPVYVKFAIDNGADGLVIIGGTTNLTSLQINAPYKDIATYSVALQGSGAYTTTGTSISSGGGAVIVGGGNYMKQYVAAGGETTITWGDMAGKECLYVSRGGMDVREILTSGSPSGDQVSWNSTLGILTFGRALESDEFVRGIFN